MVKYKKFLYVFLVGVFIIYVSRKLFSIGSDSDEKIADIIKLPISTNLTSNGELEEAFLAYTTQNQIKLMEVLIKSVHHFSNKSIIVYGVDFDIKLSKKLYPRLIVRRIESKECGAHVFNCKPLIILKSGLKYGVYVDADSIANYKVDLLFDMVHAWTGKHVLAPIHWWDPNNTAVYMKRYNIPKKTIYYVHADSILWNYRQIEFVKEWWKICKEINDANYDETALNLVLWKWNAHHSTCIYDAFYHDGYMKNDFILGDRPYIYLIFHAEKNQTIASRTFDEIIVRDDRTHNTDYLKRTCCPVKEGKTSSIHPYICEYS